MSQINPRIRYSQRQDHFLHLIDKTRFDFVPRNEASRQAALARLSEHGTKVIAALEAHAGRPLSDKELLRGVEHTDDRTAQEKVAESTKAMQQTQTTATGNPYQKALEMGLGNPRRKETRKQMYERKAQAFEEKEAAKAAATEFANDPKRVRAVQHAHQELMALRFDPNAVVSEVKAAEARLNIARTGSLADYATADREWRAAMQSKTDQTIAVVDEQIRSLRQQRTTIESATFELPTPPAPEAPKPVEIIPSEQYEQSRQATLKNDARRKEVEQQNILK